MPARHAFTLAEPLESRRLLAAAYFAVDSDLSSLKISGVADVKKAGDVKVKAQQDGSDVAHFGGTLVADISSSGVKFAGGSTIDAIANSASFAPGNTAADFGLEGKIKKLVTLATVKAAVRDLVFDVTASSRQKLKDTRFAFKKSNLKITAGTLDYVIDSKFGDADGSEELANLSAGSKDGKGRVTGKVGSRILTLPITVTYERDLDNGSVEFTLTGQIVGRETGKLAVRPGTFAEAPIASTPTRKKTNAGPLIEL